ncbi:DUF177 domain-containing protein [Lichenihabitans sp. Uapishka_5]|uniref:YceD family protein n=1 Tax=Lichenihabitans sp. Uapishka_5 TaxID=3037302 RepID=UPI0029E814C7|nr:DUF177 domain-containing protein [Lichenihabitans sp. Uapishka_5]MDX7950745.1 DUF177 domain-containing protein [Lichenihabitans sp. Uapishka_5]
MTPPAPLLSRLVPVAVLPPGGKDVTVEADAAERAALAKAYGLVELKSLVGRFTLRPAGASVNVSGRVAAAVIQTCTVSLDPFDAMVEETVELQFMPQGGIEAWLARHRPDPSLDLAYDIDPPDAIVDGKVDLGAVTAEFLAIGLDPYPRKPGIGFEDPEAAAAGKDPSPFAVLAQLKKGTEG